MKRKISKIWGIGLVVVLVASLLSFAAPVSAGELSWGAEVIPSTTGKVIQAGTDVRDLAVSGDGETIYAVTGKVGLNQWGDGEASWSDDQAKVGSYSAALMLPATTTGADAAAVVIPINGAVRLADVTSFTYDFYVPDAATFPAWGGPHMCFYVTDPVTGESAEIALEGSTVGITYTDDQWGNTVTITPALPGAYFWWEDWGGSFPTTMADTTANLFTLEAFQTDTSGAGGFSRAVIDRIQIELGWWGVYTGGTLYVDDVSLNGNTFALEDGLVDIYKSTDAGVSWSGLTSPTGADSAHLVAVASDDADRVAVVADVNEVYISINGGTTWGTLGTVDSGTGVAAAAIYDLDMSVESAGVHYIGAAGTAGTNLPGVYIFDSGAAAAGWKNACVVATTDWDGGPEEVATIDSFRAVKFSPNFASDQVMTAVSEEAFLADGSGVARFHIASFNTKTWDFDAGFPTQYPVTLESFSALNEGFSVDKAAIALAPDYLGGDDALRVAFVGAAITDDPAGTTTATEIGGIYRLKDITMKDIKPDTAIGSIGFDGVNLVAGAWTDAEGNLSNAVYRTDEPLTTTPTFSTTSSLKRPGGYSSDEVTDVIVAWANADVVAGCSGDESAFAVSKNNGKSFNDISLIDTALTNLTDVAVSADGSQVYLATDDGTDFSLWRKAGSWERVLAVDGKSGFIVRLAPEDADVIYAVDKGTTSIYYASDADEKWFTRTGRYSVKDLAVESSDVAYIGVSGAKTVSKSTNSGFTWATAKSTSLAGGDIHSIVSLAEDKLIVGSTSGYVSYSTDGNSSWTKISKQLESGALLTQVTASGLADDDYIYAASSLASSNTTAVLIVRWQIGTSTAWKSLSAPITTTTYGVYGLTLEDGVLYAANSDGADSEVIRNLTPTNAAPSTGHWSTMASALEAFTAAPQALKVSAGSNKLWAVDTTGGDLFSFTDTLADTGPTLTSPADEREIAVNPVSGVSYDASLSWERLSKASAYEVDVALDEGFAEKVVNLQEVATTLAAISYVVDGSTLMPDTTYYWRVRVLSTEAAIATEDAVFSPFSEVRSFIIGELPDVAPVVIKQIPPPTITIPPAPPAPQITLQPPDIVIPPAPPAPEIVIPPAPPAPAPITPAFIWAIVIIGAILVIAVIVLVVRTRRPI